jgi:DNA-directed RNA polymerase III subunit RPC1
MGTPGVNFKLSKSNHIIEMLETLGVEASRLVIQSELHRTYKSYGIGIDPRHLRLLADVMTYRGEVLGITRFGIAKMKDSVLMLASFEKTPDHLFDAAIHARQDGCLGVSESIIIGAPIPLGTGLFKLMHQFEAPTRPRIETEPSGAPKAGAGATAGDLRRAMDRV